MSTHRESAEIHEITSIAHPMRRLVAFYLANGYRLAERTGEFASEIDAPSDADLRNVKFVRGKPGNGWWAANMAELHTRVSLTREDDTREDDTIYVDYEIDSTGQILSQIERAFWQNERQSAERYMRGSSKQPRDLRSEEASRAHKRSRGFHSFGLTSAVAVFLIIIVLGFLGII